MTKQTAEQTIATARIYAPRAAMRSSAEFCICDAEALIAAGNYSGAHTAAVRSLKYSVGILSPVYIAAAALSNGRT